MKTVRFFHLWVALAMLACSATFWAQSKGIDPALLAKAKAGDADAEFRVAIGYANLGNPKESHHWHLMAAENGNVRAMTIVAADYELGRYVARDDKLAFTWYRKAADAGDLSAITNVGDLYERGVGVQQDFVQAAAWYRKAAEQGDQYAQLDLGLLYENGKGVDQDYSRAALWFRKAADQGNADAQRELGSLYDSGQGVPTSYLQAALWWRKAAEQGNAEAQVQLGILYEVGLAENHDASDGQAIHDASKVRGSDYAQAIFWFRRAAEKGNANGEFSLGDMYEEGKGVPQDFTEAAFWYRKAAEQGHATAQFSIGVAYYNGQGVPQDYAEAYFWLDLAAMGNAASFIQQDIEKLRDDAAANLTKTVLLQTQERARKWFEDHSDKANSQ